MSILFYLFVIFVFIDSVVMNFFYLFFFVLPCIGQPSLGKSAFIGWMKKVHKAFIGYNDQFIKKWNLKFNPMAYNYLINVCRYKVAIEEAGKRDGQGLIHWSEGSM